MFVQDCFGDKKTLLSVNSMEIYLQILSLSVWHLLTLDTTKKGSVLHSLRICLQTLKCESIRTVKWYQWYCHSVAWNNWSICGGKKQQGHEVRSASASNRLWVCYQTSVTIKLLIFALNSHFNFSFQLCLIFTHMLTYHGIIYNLFQFWMSLPEKLRCSQV